MAGHVRMIQITSLAVAKGLPDVATLAMLCNCNFSWEETEAAVDEVQTTIAEKRANETWREEDDEQADAVLEILDAYLTHLDSQDTHPRRRTGHVHRGGTMSTFIDQHRRPECDRILECYRGLACIVAIILAGYDQRSGADIDGAHWNMLDRWHIRLRLAIANPHNDVPAATKLAVEALLDVAKRMERDTHGS